MTLNDLLKNQPDASLESLIDKYWTIVAEFDGLMTASTLADLFIISIRVLQLDVFEGSFLLADWEEVYNHNELNISRQEIENELYYKIKEIQIGF